MDRDAAMLLLLGILAVIVLLLLAFFSIAPVFCSCLVSLLYTLYLFLANEESGVHSAQEFENRFWTIFTILFTTALFFAHDSPIAVGKWSPSLGFLFVIATGYGVHAYDRHLHRQALSRKHGLTRGLSGVVSLNRLKALGIPVEQHLYQINSCLSDIDKLLIPSTINNIINIRFILKKERELISVFDDADPKVLNYLIQHVKLGLLFYKVKDHRHFSGKHRTELIELLAVTRISVLTVLSKVLVLHALQMMKIAAHPRAEYWVRNLLLETSQDNLSELKTLNDAKGNYFCMNKLIYDDIRKESIRQDILRHFKKEAAVQQAHMLMNTKKAKVRKKKAWRKILSDVDDTLYCSGGSYPAGVDKRFGKKVVYPGVLSFYRELDLGLHGPEKWPENAVGNLVFLSARPHVYKDVSEKHNFAKFEKLRCRGMHTNPSLLAGDIASGSTYMLQNDMEPLAIKKFENFKRYVTIYPEFKHIFVGDNGQGDVRAGDLMFDAFPNHLEILYVHVVKPIDQTHGYNPEQWRKKGIKICFFRTYPDAALDAATRDPPLIRVDSLRRVCEDAVRDFKLIEAKQWPSPKHQRDRLDELNQGLWRANEFILSRGEPAVPLINSERKWNDGQQVKTPFGNAIVVSFDPVFNLYEVIIDWRPLDIQVAKQKNKDHIAKSASPVNRSRIDNNSTLATVIENKEVEEDYSELNDVAIRIDEDPTEEYEKKNKSKFENMIPEHEGIQNYGKSDMKISYQNLDMFQSTNETQESMVNAQGPLQGRSSESNTEVNEVNGINSNEIKAKINGRFISDFIPPSLPVFQKDKSRSIFSFWATEKERQKSKEKPYLTEEECSTPFGNGCIKEYRREDAMVIVTMKGWSAIAYLRQDCVKRLGKKDKKRTFSFWKVGTKPKHKQFVVGAECNTQFGLGIIKEYKQDISIVVVTMREWSAVAFLQEDCVQIMGKGLLGTIFSGSFRKLGQTENSTEKNDKEKQVVELVVSFPVGTAVHSPFGEGFVSRTLSLEKHCESQSCARTIGISLTNWTLANETHPALYCTPEAAKEWNAMKSKDKNHIFSVFGTIVSTTMRKFKSGPSNSESKLTKKEPNVVFERYFLDGASVSTSFGNGRVNHFRESDGIYEIYLITWKLKDNQYPKAFFYRDALSYRLAEGCSEGYPVLTSYGFTGNLASVQPTTGVHIVTVPSAGLVCYLQPNQILKAIKAAVGDDVLTPYGEGTVIKLRIVDGIFEIDMKGWCAKLFLVPEAFDRVDDGVRNSEKSVGMNWLLRWMFFSSDKKKLMDGGSQRSRASSVSSRSIT